MIQICNDTVLEQIIVGKVMMHHANKKAAKRLYQDESVSVKELDKEVLTKFRWEWLDEKPFCLPPHIYFVKKCWI